MAAHPLVLKLGDDELYRPATPEGQSMLEHLSGGCCAINDSLLAQVTFLALAHGWGVVIDRGET